MYALPGYFEFLSDAWLDEARAFLTKTVERRKDALPPFSLAERFGNAPPHLGMPGGAAAWSVRWDGETLAVGRDFDPEADVVVEGDYQAAVTAAQFVGLLAPGAMEEMRREVATLYGRDAIRVRGQVPEAVAELTTLTHDHLGRRTVENPDLAHRAHGQGLAGHIRQMEEQGYAVIENAISAEFADEVRAAVIRALLPHQTFAMNWMLYHGREFERLIQNPQLMTLIDASLGRGAVIASFSCIKKGPGAGVIPLHTDYAHVPEPYPDFALTGVGVWALEDWTLASGPTWIVPGSHRLRRPPRPGEAAKGAVPIEMPKGSVVYFTRGVWHWQGDRTEPGERITLHAHFNRGILRSLEPKRTDVQLLHRNAPRLGEMLGEDDWFDKMSAEGRDYVRFAYMNRLLAFTEDRKRALLAEGVAQAAE
ncbi:MAG TPA: phytanoyl-CoA dioxygenase family protein [Caulobacteraceae bacterium]|nr:phytanoyl-CoA dioxygenase family protein [Caulobacteraceae bacterium]